jgi:hypothetical protein
LKSKLLDNEIAAGPTQTDNEGSLVSPMRTTHIEKSNNFQSFMLTFKLFFGVSYLAIPNVFSKTGIVGGIVLYTSAISINAYTMI